MIEIKSLKDTDTGKILTAFNDSFADYLIPLQLTPDQLKDKIIGENIDLDYSAGVFDEDKLIAFMLHGVRRVDGIKTAYNAGTGVLPDYRGHAYTEKMYDYLRQVFVKEKISRVVLEVLCENVKALHVYSQIGFQPTRKLNCYKGNVSVKEGGAPYNVEKINDPEWDLLRPYWDYVPTWQNSGITAANLAPYCVRLVIAENDLIIGYVLMNIKTQRILQCSVHPAYRRRGVASALFEYVKCNYTNQLVAINVNENSISSIELLKSLGLELFTQQLEMVKTLEEKSN